MKRHLDEREMCQWLAGERSLAAEEHASGCAQCRAEVARMAEVMAGFQDSVRERSALRQTKYDPSWAHGWRAMAGAMAKRGGGAWNGWGWTRLWVGGLAAAVIGLVLWLPRIATRSVRAPVEGQASIEAQASEDAALLKRIDADMSRAVPGPMEPLTKLIEWQQETGDGDADGEIDALDKNGCVGTRAGRLGLGARAGGTW